jgi:hypothetical protein
MESFRYLASIYDHDTSLPVHERIDLYSKLINEPLVKDDVMTSIRAFAHELRRQRNFTSLKILLESCRLSFVPKDLFYDEGHNVHAFASESEAIARRIIERWPATYSTTIEHPFVKEVERMNLTDLFASILRFIYQSKHQDELMKRLYEEMDEGQGTCTTGHICRLINVVRGYMGNHYETKMTIKDHDKNVVFNLLNNRVDMMDPSGILTGIHTVIKATRHNELKDISDNALIKYLCDYTKEDRDIIITLIK